jgi:hypothetical protein
VMNAFMVFLSRDASAMEHLQGGVLTTGRRFSAQPGSNINRPTLGAAGLF